MPSRRRTSRRAESRQAIAGVWGRHPQPECASFIPLQRFVRAGCEISARLHLPDRSRAGKSERLHHSSIVSVHCPASISMPDIFLLSAEEILRSPSQSRSSSTHQLVYRWWQFWPLFGVPCRLKGHNLAQLCWEEAERRRQGVKDEIRDGILYAARRYSGRHPGPDGSGRVPRGGPARKINGSSPGPAEKKGRARCFRSGDQRFGFGCDGEIPGLVGTGILALPPCVARTPDIVPGTAMANAVYQNFLLFRKCGLGLASALPDAAKSKVTSAITETIFLIFTAGLHSHLCRLTCWAGDDQIRLSGTCFS